jgi:hypothetical protein
VLPVVSEDVVGSPDELRPRISHEHGLVLLARVVVPPEPPRLVLDRAFETDLHHLQRASTLAFSIVVAATVRSHNSMTAAQYLGLRRPGIH